MTQLTIGIGCTHEQDLAAEVLRFSIERSTQLRPAFIKLHQTPHWAQMTTPLRSRQRTPFSLQRFLLARQLLDGSAEIGIYLDSDMLVLRPIEHLVASFRATGSKVATVQPLKEWRRRHQSSVLVMNREGAELIWASYQNFLSGSLSYDDLIYMKTISAIGAIDYLWNCLEYLDETTALLHYTDVETQPWLRDGNPNAGIWYTYLWRFSQDPRQRELLLSAVAKGHVRPSLLEVLKQGPSLTALSRHARIRDLFFVPPHRFRKLSSPWMRTALAPLMRTLMSLQFITSNGQPNVR
jgi:hypothetical protein